MRAQVRGALVILLALAAAVLAHAHQVSFKARVDLVRVDVLVTDQGRPISGLTRSDFELRDDGQVQEIDAAFGAAPASRGSHSITSSRPHGLRWRASRRVTTSGC
jgi:hypothetical protein